MILQTVSLSSAGKSEWIKMGTGLHDQAKYSLLLEFGGASAVADVEYAISDADDSPTPITDDVLHGVTEDYFSSLDIPVTAFRLNLVSHTSGTVTLRIIQGSV